MSYCKSFRIPLLALTLSSSLLVLGKLMLYPSASSRTVTPLTFPSTVLLPGWQFAASSPLADQTDSHPNYLTGRRYQYVQNDLPLDIDMRYVVNTDGDVKQLIKTFASTSSSLAVRQRQEIGFYSLFTHQGKAYLSSCINPRGGSTVTGRQFKENRNAYDLQSSRLLPWLLGQETLKDERCLWAHLSIPLRQTSPAFTYHLLESAWFSWYQQWQPRFSKP